MSAAPGSRSARTHVWLFILGTAVLTGLGFWLGIRVDERGMELVGIGATGMLLGIGYLIRPWTPEMRAANTGPNARIDRLWRAMPLFWKLWFVGSLVVGMGVMVAALLLL